MSVKNCCWTVLVSLLLCVGTTRAQVTTGTILGTVSDSSGAVVPGATITIRNVETGISRALTADAAGRYLAPQLPLGNYEVTAGSAGFQTMIRRGIELSLGRQAEVNFNLQVGAVAEAVTVTGEAPLIETTTSSVSGLVNPSQMRDLPLNVRSYEQLAFLQPNVYWQRNAIDETNTGYAPKISAGGMRVGYNAYIVDGIDIADTTGLTPGSVAGGLAGVETVREYRVLTNNFPAQYGNALGAIIEVASKGGTNSFHGTVFEFLRNSAMDARNFFDPKSVPPFRRNQFGGILGGPIVKDRLFFFASYEALRERLTTTRNVLTPTADAKRGIFPDPADPTKTLTIPVNPAVVPYLALYPLPQLDLGSGVGRYSFPFNNVTGEDYLTGRVDYQRSDKVSYFARYTFDDGERIAPKAGVAIDPWADRSVSRNQTITLAETRLLTGALINEFRAGFVRYTPASLLYLTGPDPQIQFPNTGGAGNIAFTTGYSAGGTGIATLGIAARPFERQNGNTYQVTDNVSYVKSAHSLKIGFNMERFQDNVLERTMEGLYANSGSGTSNQGDTFTFESVERLIQGRPRSFSGVLTPSAQGTSGRVWLFAWYFQDDYRLRSNLTLNLGVRYEFLTPYANRNRDFVILNDLFGTPKRRQEKASEGNTCSGCIDPRFGFAWDLFSNGATVLKGGFGIFRNQLLHFNGYYTVPTEAQGGINLSADNPNFPDPTVQIPGAVLRYSLTGTGNVGATVRPRIPATPSAMQWNLTLDQRLTPNMTVRLAYLASKGYHLDSGYTANINTYEDRPDGTRFFAPGVHRIRPEFAGINTIRWDFNSMYNAFTVTLGRRLSRGIGFESSYAFSRATDDTSLGLAWRVHLTSEMRTPDGRRNTFHGLSGLDMRHRSVSNFTYELPSYAGTSGAAKKLLSGWQMNGILTLQSGTPLTPWIGFDRANTRAANAGEQQRPDINPAYSGSRLCPCTVPSALGGGVQEAPQRYFNPAAFLLPAAGTDGNLGRNTLIGPGFTNFDFALVKNTALTERVNLLFRLETFNLFNRVNWSQPSNRLFETSGAYTGSTGVITATSNASRQLQFALKLTF